MVEVMFWWLRFCLDSFSCVLVVEVVFWWHRSYFGGRAHISVLEIVIWWWRSYYWWWTSCFGSYGHHAPQLGISLEIEYSSAKTPSIRLCFCLIW